MVADPSPLLKLWWKGVDIAANVISATLSAGVVAWFARRFIRWKHDDDLTLEKKKRELAVRHAREDVEQTRAICVSRLESERGKLSEKIMTAPNPKSAIADCRDWAKANDLLDWQTNLAIFDGWSHKSSWYAIQMFGLLQGVQQPSKDQVAEYANEVMKVILPAPSDDRFPWPIP